MKLLLNHARLLYEALYHKPDYSVIHCQDVENGKFIGRKIVCGESEILKAIIEFNGRGNTFLSRNPVNSAGKVTRISTLTLDLDPEEYDKRIGSSKDQMEVCERAGRDILENYPGGWLAFSGNGCLVGLPFELNWMEDIKNFPVAFKAWAEKFAKPIVAKTKGVKLDDLYDNERLLKAVGTISCRGEKRLTRFLILPSGRKPITRLQEEFRGIYESISIPKEANQFNGQSIINSESATALPSRTKIGHPNRQKYLVSLAGSLHRRGLSEQFIFEAVKKAYQENCVLEPIKTDAKLLEIVTSIMKYPNEEGLKHYGSIIAATSMDGSNEASSKESELREYTEFLNSKGTFKEAELTTGFKSLDDLCNGYQRGDIFTLGAYTGGGKSTLLVNSADALCKAGKRVLFLSTEMAKFAIFNKFFSLNTGTNYVVYDKGNFTTEELDKRNEFAKVFKDYNLIVDDDLKLSEQSTRLLVERNKPDVLIFDHIHEVGNGSNNYYGFLKDFTHGLQLIARDYNCAVVLAAQFQRPPRLLDAATGQYKKPPRPTSQSIKACGDIENKSRVVALLSDSFSSLYPDENMMILDIAKCSKGSKGEIRLKWKWKASKFEEA